MSKLKTFWQGIRLIERINWFVSGDIFSEMIPTQKELIELQKQRIATLEQAEKAWPVLIDSYRNQATANERRVRSIKEYAQNVLGDGLRYGDQELEVQHIIDICNDILGEWDDEPEIFNHEIERESIINGERNND